VLSQVAGRASDARLHYGAAVRADASFAEARVNLGTALRAAGKLAHAESQYVAAVHSDPSAETWQLLGEVRRELHDLEGACDAFAAALQVEPEHWPALYGLADAKQFACAWGDREQLFARVTDHVAHLARGDFSHGPDERLQGGLSPFSAIMFPLSPNSTSWVSRVRARQDKLAAESLVRSGGARPASLAWACGGAALARRHADLRIGLLSADFGSHPVGHALLPFIHRLRHAAAVAVHCFAADAPTTSHPGTPLRRKIAAAASSFLDVTQLPQGDAARVIARERPHVLFNLVGHTAGARNVLAHLRPAPIQACHFGFAGTTGLRTVHYFVSDVAASPAPQSAALFTEKLAMMPHSHFVANHAIRYPTTVDAGRQAHPLEPRALAEALRAGGPLPERSVAALAGGWFTRRDAGSVAFAHDAFVLCNFNQLYKHDPDSFTVWSNALRRTPHAVLWLTQISVKATPGDVSMANLVAEAGARGMHASRRLSFSGRYDDGDMSAVRGLADLAVDNEIFNGHTTTADTLWGGVPVVGLRKANLASRATVSFARAMGLQELAMSSHRDYEDFVTRLGHAPVRMAQLRHKCAVRRTEWAGSQGASCGMEAWYCSARASWVNSAVGRHTQTPEREVTRLDEATVLSTLALLSLLYPSSCACVRRCPCDSEQDCRAAADRTLFRLGRALLGLPRACTSYERRALSGQHAHAYPARLLPPR